MRKIIISAICNLKNLSIPFGSERIELRNDLEKLSDKSLFIIYESLTSK